ncbi:hypothetical protein [Stenotrophomonas rhizophila]|uniref:hypothetical protein n=1 Tax=Stenotrophomonas rhizophila TaxID=216778 RepID=UPI000456F8FE|nr:hypothetical protein [Stenotrophomonas rhizophila]AHY59172.1 hypothetical protein DX03_10855 [Stenotrophomonas rhizophila]
MPTKRLALVGCLSLLAACSPQAGDSGAHPVDAVPAAAAPVAATPAPAMEEAPDVALAAAADAPLDADADADEDVGMPDLEQLERARAAAGCEVSGDVGNLADIRIYCAMPADVRAFLERENTCQHFAGEEPYDEERRQELEQASAEYCDGRERIFAALYERHHDECKIRHALRGVGKRYDLFTGPVPAADCQP